MCIRDSSGIDFDVMFQNLELCRSIKKLIVNFVRKFMPAFRKLFRQFFFRACMTNRFHFNRIKICSPFSFSTLLSDNDFLYRWFFRKALCNSKLRLI